MTLFFSYNNVRENEKNGQIFKIYCKIKCGQTKNTYVCMSMLKIESEISAHQNVQKEGKNQIEKPSVIDKNVYECK